MEKEKPGKSGPLTQADLGLLGYHKVSPLQTTGAFRIFIARTQAGIGETTHAFVYPLTTAREHDIREVERMVATDQLGQDHRASKTYVVVPKGLQIRPNLQSSRAEAHVYEDLIWERIETDFSEYMEEFQQATENLLRGVSYVEPSFSSGGVEGTPPTEYLHSFLSGKEEGEGIVVIQGGAMFGKTTLAAKVARELSQGWKSFRVVPVLLRGQTTWRALAESSRDREISSLWDILSLVLRQDDLSHERGEGLLLKNEELFRRIMQQGYVALIFDGFDELPKARGARISPRDNFDWLSEVAENSSARILVTTRPDFWKREVGSAAERPPLDLASFDKEKAYRYFEQAVPEDSAKAKDMYQQMLRGVPSKDEDNFVKLPACARMIADYVKNGGTTPLTMGSDQQSMLRGFLMQILERERQRQQISVPATVMHRAFEEMAVSFNGEFDLSELECALPPNMDESELGKIPDHAFVDPTDGKFRFRQDFLTHYLKAHYVCRLLMESPDTHDIVQECRRNGDLRKLIDEESDGGGQLPERVADFLDMRDLSKLGRMHSRIVDSKHPLKSLLFHVIAKTFIERMKTTNASRSEQADEVLLLLGGNAESRTVSNLFVQGEIRGLSLGGWKIANSCFSNLRLAQCGNKPPRFVKCEFEKGFDWGNVKFDRENFKDCKPLDSEARLWMVKIDGRRDTDEDIQNYMRIVLGRFWGANNVRPIDKIRWNTGITREINKRFDILGAMHRHGFIEQAMHGRRLKVKGEAIGDLRDFLENGAIRGSVQQIFDAMREKVRSPGN